MNKSKQSNQLIPSQPEQPSDLCCAPVPHQFAKAEGAVALSNGKTQKNSQLLPTSFLPASYFLLMILAIAALPEFLIAGRITNDPQALLSIGLWAINSMVFCVVSFLYYSEGDSHLKARFATLRISSLSFYPMLFWWALYHHSAAVQVFEWSVVFGGSTSALLLFAGFALKLQQKQLLTMFLFISSALLCYAGSMVWETARAPLAGYLVVAGLISLGVFALQTQSQLRNKCQSVELLLILSLIVQWLGMHSVVAS